MTLGAHRPWTCRPRHGDVFSYLQDLRRTTGRPSVCREFAGQIFSDCRIESIRRKFALDGVSAKRDFWRFYITTKSASTLDRPTSQMHQCGASRVFQLRQLPQEPQLLEWFTQIVWVRRNPDFGIGMYLRNQDGWHIQSFLFFVHIFFLVRWWFQIFSYLQTAGK